MPWDGRRCYAARGELLSWRHVRRVSAKRRSRPGPFSYIPENDLFVRQPTITGATPQICCNLIYCLLLVTIEARAVAGGSYDGEGMCRPQAGSQVRGSSLRVCDARCLLCRTCAGRLLVREPRGTSASLLDHCTTDSEILHKVVVLPIEYLSITFERLGAGPGS